MAKSNVLITLALALVMVFASAVSVHGAVGSQLPVSVTEVQVNGDTLNDNETTRTSMDSDNTLNIKVKVKSETNATLENVEVTAFIAGYDYNYNSDERLSATTRPFSVDSDVEYTKSLQVTLPELLNKGDYKLRIVVADAYGAAQIYNYNLKIEANQPKVVIRDVVFSPDGEVMAGRALLTTVRIKNTGDTTEQGIKVKVAIPELGISATQYIDELEEDKSISTEELYMRIPACAKADSYGVEVTVTYDEGHGVSKTTKSIEVVGDSACTVPKPKPTTDEDETPTTPVKPAKEDKIVVTIAPQIQTVTRGEGGAIYQLTLSNEGSSDKTYIISIDGADAWAVTRMSPSAIVGLASGEQKSIYVYVTAKESTQSGTHVFVVNLKEGDKVLKQISLSAEVTEPEVKDNELKNALEIGLIVLLVLLVIIALIVGFNKMRGKKEGQESTQTYY
jgi:uncharacterized membrane protein